MSRRNLPLATSLILFGLSAVALAQDPFGEEFKAAPREVKAAQPAPKQQPEGDAKKVSPTTQAIAGHVEFKARVEPARARRGQIVKVTIEGESKPYAYTYSAVRKHPTQSGIAARISYPGTPWVKPLFPIQESGVEEKKSTEGTSFILHDHFRWSQDVLIADDAAPGSQSLPVEIFLQVCTKQDEMARTADSCYPPTKYLPLKVALEILDGPALPPPADLQARLVQPPLLPDLRSQPGAADTTTTATETTTALANLRNLLLAAVGGALLMLLTPCVFPMIPITVNFFIKQAEREHHRPFFMASVYAGTIVLLLTGIMLVGGTVVIRLALNPWFNLGMGIVLVMFALGLFGMFEVDLTKFFGTVLFIGVGYLLAWVLQVGLSWFPSLPMALRQSGWVLTAVSLLLAFPLLFGLAHAVRKVESLFGFEESSVLRFLSVQESKGGAFGAAFMAMTFTITSFSCTGPFLGILLAPLAETRPPISSLVLAALAYSLTFAAPFFLLALFPTWLKKLPKSGGWMTTIKVTMGFLEIAAALKFLSNTDLAWYREPPFFNYDTVLCAWIALSVTCSLYLFGAYHLHHDSPTEQIGVVRMLFASLFLGLSLYLAPLLFGITPRGALMEGIVSFLPYKRDDGTGPIRGGSPASPGHQDLPWIVDDYHSAWTKAVKENKLIFIDFTGVNCQNCRENERNVLSKPNVVQELKKYVTVQLFTDFVQKENLTEAEKEALKEKQLGYQIGLVKTVTQPTYVILEPNPNQAFANAKDGELPNGRVLGMRDGKIFDAADFLRFLQEPVKGRPAENRAAAPTERQGAGDVRAGGE